MKKYLFSVCLFFLIALNILAQEKFYKVTTPVPVARQMYGAVVLGDYLYVIGGHSTKQSSYITSVQKAFIFPNGYLKDWIETTPIPAGRSYIENSTIALNDIVYVVAGFDGTKNKCWNTILWTRPRADGHLEKWRESPAYPGEGIHCSVAVATPGYIHLIAGAFSGTGNSVIPSELVWTARVASDGVITGWERGNPLPTKLWYHCGAVAGGYVWIWGGLIANDRTSVNKVVYRAPILSSGRLGQWQPSGSELPQPFYSASCTVSGPFLLSFCPRYSGAVVSNDIWYTYVEPQGLSKWVKQEVDIPPRLYIGLATDYRRGNIYIPGGRITYEDKSTINQNVYYFRLRSAQQEDVKTDVADTIDATGQRAGIDHLSYIQQIQKTTGSFPGFLPYEQARQISLLQRKPMVIYFYLNKATRCQEQAQILQNFNPGQYVNKVVFAEIDTMQFPQFSQQYGVFRIPCWLFFNAFGDEKSRVKGVLQIEEIDNYIHQIAP